MVLRPPFFLFSSGKNGPYTISLSMKVDICSVQSLNGVLHQFHYMCNSMNKLCPTFRFYPFLPFCPTFRASNSKLEIGPNPEGIPSSRCLRGRLTTFAELRSSNICRLAGLWWTPSELCRRGQTSPEGPETWYTFRIWANLKFGV